MVKFYTPAAHSLTTVTSSIRPLLILLCIIIGGPSSGVQAVEPLPWEQKYTQIQLQRDIVFTRLEAIHAELLLRVQEEAPALLSKLSLDPPKARKTGYALLPRIKKNSPHATVKPKQTYYSLKWLKVRLQEELKNADTLADKVTQAIEIEPLVDEFNQVQKKLRNLENNLTYHKKWQKAVVKSPGFFREKNKLVSLAREINTLVLNDGSPQRIALLREQLAQSVAPFRRTQGLALVATDGGESVLPVTLCTDIDDPEFLQDFHTGVREAFSESAAARAQQFSVELHWRLIGVDTLYPEGAPTPGTKINMKAHRALFPDCPLVLTTGAAALNAFAGDHIYLGTRPVSRRAWSSGAKTRQPRSSRPWRIRRSTCR
jgi:hypothetical protein